MQRHARAGSSANNNSYDRWWLIPGALTCAELFEATQTTHTKFSAGTDENQQYCDALYVSMDQRLLAKEK